MCGRIHQNIDEVGYEEFSQDEIAAAIDRLGYKLEPRYNVAPGTNVPVFIAGKSDNLEIRKMTWGLRRRWMKKEHRPPVNARGETITEKPMFRGLLESTRCLVPVKGYYEWMVNADGKRIPHYISDPEGKQLLLAGIYDVIMETGSDPVETFTIITTIPSIEHIHDRMPVIIDPGNYKWWLDRENHHRPYLQTLLIPYRGELQVHRVSTRVNNARNQGDDLIEASVEVA